MSLSCVFFGCHDLSGPSLCFFFKYTFCCMLTNPGQVRLCEIDVEECVIETTCGLEDTKRIVHSEMCVQLTLGFHTAIRNGFQDWRWLA